MIKYICTRVVFSGQQRFYSMEQAVSQSVGQSAGPRLSARLWMDGQHYQQYQSNNMCIY